MATWGREHQDPSVWQSSYNYECDANQKRLIEKAWADIKSKFDKLSKFEGLTHCLEEAWDNTEIICGGQQCKDNSSSLGFNEGKVYPSSGEYKTSGKCKIRLCDNLKDQYVPIEPKTDGSGGGIPSSKVNMFDEDIEDLASVLLHELVHCCYGTSELDSYVIQHYIYPNASFYPGPGELEKICAESLGIYDPWASNTGYMGTLGRYVILNLRDGKAWIRDLSATGYELYPDAFGEELGIFPGLTLRPGYPSYTNPCDDILTWVEDDSGGWTLKISFG